MRLVYTDQTAEDLDTADFDGDGLGNLEEITTHHTHPLRADSDSDGLPDGWEIGHGLDPNDDGSVNPVNGGFGDPDGDGSNNLNELAGGNDPQSAADFPAQLIYVTREAFGNSLVPSSGVPGTASWFCNWTGDSDNGNLSGSLTASTLSGGLSSRYEFPDEPPSDPQFFVASNFESAYFSLIGTYTTYSNNGFTTARGNQVEAKVWLKSPSTVEARSFKMVKVTRRLSLPLNTTGGPAAPEESSITAVDVETFNIGGSEELSEGKEVLPQVPSTPGTREKVVVSLLNPEIKPDDNMAGVIGDMVPSNLGAAGEKHFVTPKKTDELPQEYVMFKATGVTVEQISPGEGQVVEWVGGEAVPDQPLKRQVKRDQVTDPAVELKIMTKPKEGAAKEQAKVNVWVVWSEAAPTQPYLNVAFSSLPSGGVFDFPAATYGGIASKTTHWRFKFVISPSEIITNPDHPDFSGLNKSPAPGQTKSYFADPLMPADHASAKWDVSRKVEIQISNPNSIPKNKFPNRYIFKNQPKIIDKVVPFPLNPVEGNDDPGGINWLDEDDDPYQASQLEGLAHGIGEITSRDGPTFAFENSIGVSAATLAEIANFKEFARLEIFSGKEKKGAQAWYRISDFTNWYHVMAGTFGEHPVQHVPAWIDADSDSKMGIFVVPEE